MNKKTMTAEEASGCVTCFMFGGYFDKQSETPSIICYQNDECIKNQRLLHQKKVVEKEKPISS